MLKIIHYSYDLYNEALLNLPSDYIKNLKNKSKESLIARYEIFKQTEHLVSTDTDGIPIINSSIFWNISHKNDLIFIGTCKTSIGIDIEIIKQRSKEIYSLHKSNEYLLFDGENIQNFYKLWTLKESVIKLNFSSIDYLDDIKIISVNKQKNIIDNIVFNYIVYSNFMRKDIVSYIGVEDDIVYSVSYFKK